MKKILLSAAAVFMLSSVAACSGAGSDTTDENEEKRVAAVEVTEAKKGDMSLERSVFGRTAPNMTTPILLQAPGEIDSLEVSNGDEVEEDEIIAKIKNQMGTQNIRAPKDGEITNLTASEGETVSNEEPFAIVADLETIKVNVAVTADVRKLFEVDKKMTATINNKEYEATISSISTMPDESGLYPIEARVKNEAGEILPGMVAEIAVPEKRIKDAVIVPTSAIVEEEDETFVYIVEDQIAKKQAVTVVETQSAQSAIEGDVQPGDQLVVTGQLTLSDGVQVNVMKGENK